ncbi:hypothetical protein F1737_02280 [Methanoplanus sp. FWC-SCC4]|uniref:RNase III domain-containing protein n=1 Tax=Methanochimaera problematica TaxID=2609417 RepID=A0AA97FAJ5_9EURY|nr:hypothetical protein F1737_02280 [Methanoplanus sp. FWC-SCC4]
MSFLFFPKCKYKDIKTAVLAISKWLNEKSKGEKNSRDKDKQKKWIHQLEDIVKKIEVVENNIIPDIERDLGYRFNDHNFLVTAFFMSNTKNVYMEILEEYHGYNHSGIDRITMKYLEKLPEIAKTLAWIGDTVIKSALLDDIDICNMADINTDILTVKRQKYEQNTNLANLSDKWKLLENSVTLKKITTQDTKKIAHLKGSLVESIFGALYIDLNLNPKKNQDYDINKKILKLIIPDEETDNYPLKIKS